MKFDMGVFLCKGNPDGFAGRSIVDGIMDDVCHRFLQIAGIGYDKQVRLDIHVKSDLFVLAGKIPAF